VLRPWEFKIIIRPSSRTPVYLQIVHAIIDEIRRGRVEPGRALPGSRELARTLNVNRKTVVQAYDELTAQGWLSTQETKGTFVSLNLPAVGASTAEDQRTKRTKRMPEAPSFKLQGREPRIPIILPVKNRLTFDDGEPDTRLLPANALARAYRQALVSMARQNALGYGDPRGRIELRQAISTMLNVDRGLTSTADNICLTRGSQMAIFLVSRILAGRGDTVVTETLSYPPARESFISAGADVVAVGLDAQGMRVDELEAICRKKRVTAVYVTPHHQFPTTVLMTVERRIRLLSLAAQFGFALVEDDYDHEYHFLHQPMLTLASADPTGKVVYIGSMSKILSPHVRLGYIAAPKAFIDRVASEIMMVDRQGDPVTELAVAQLIQSGDVHSHTRKVMKIYVERRDAFAELLVKHFNSDVEFSLPDGGLAFWLRFGPSIDVESVTRAARRIGVDFLPGSHFSNSGAAVQAARLGFARMTTEELQIATRKLRESFRSR
jgi:GntR family transcriptional regulator / MocR family aminotransferase